MRYATNEDLPLSFTRSFGLDETDTDGLQCGLARTLKQKIFAGKHVTHVKNA